MTPTRPRMISALAMSFFMTAATPAFAVQGILPDNGGNAGYTPRNNHKIPIQTDILVGKQAPDFVGLTSEGQTVRLSDFKGKIIVMEWHTPECPFVKKHYDSKNMQKLQAYARSEGVVWLTINSNGAERPGHLEPRDAQAYFEKMEMQSNHYIIDTEGKIGYPYQAKTTPDMVIIDSGGYVAYTGAIDDKATADPADIPKARNYVQSAIENLLIGKPASPYATQSYGCQIKYRSLYQ